MVWVRQAPDRARRPWAFKPSPRGIRQVAGMGSRERGFVTSTWNLDPSWWPHCPLHCLSPSTTPPLSLHCTFSLFVYKSSPNPHNTRKLSAGPVTPFPGPSLPSQASSVALEAAIPPRSHSARLPFSHIQSSIQPFQRGLDPWIPRASSSTPGEASTEREHLSNEEAAEPSQWHPGCPYWSCLRHAPSQPLPLQLPPPTAPTSAPTPLSSRGATRARNP